MCWCHCLRTALSLADEALCVSAPARLDLETARKQPPLVFACFAGHHDIRVLLCLSRGQRTLNGCRKIAYCLCASPLLFLCFFDDHRIITDCKNVRSTLFSPFAFCRHCCFLLRYFVFQYRAESEGFLCRDGMAAVATGVGGNSLPGRRTTIFAIPDCGIDTPTISRTGKLSYSFLVL